MFNACPHENGEQIKQLYNLAILFIQQGKV
jgi:hypothetical protein